MEAALADFVSFHPRDVACTAIVVAFAVVASLLLVANKYLEVTIRPRIKGNHHRKHAPQQVPETNN